MGVYTPRNDTRRNADDGERRAIHPGCASYGPNPRSAERQNSYDTTMTGCVNCVESSSGRKKNAQSGPYTEHGKKLPLTRLP